MNPSFENLETALLNETAPGTSKKLNRRQAPVAFSGTNSEMDKLKHARQSKYENSKLSTVPTVSDPALAPKARAERLAKVDARIHFKSRNNAKLPLSINHWNEVSPLLDLRKPYLDGTHSHADRILIFSRTHKCPHGRHFNDWKVDGSVLVPLCDHEFETLSPHDVPRPKPASRYKPSGFLTLMKSTALPTIPEQTFDLTSCPICSRPLLLITRLCKCIAFSCTRCKASHYPHREWKASEFFETAELTIYKNFDIHRSQMNSFRFTPQGGAISSIRDSATAFAQTVFDNVKSFFTGVYEFFHDLFTSASEKVSALRSWIQSCDVLKSLSETFQFFSFVASQIFNTTPFMTFVDLFMLTNSAPTYVLFRIFQLILTQGLYYLHAKRPSSLPGYHLDDDDLAEYTRTWSDLPLYLMHLLDSKNSVAEFIFEFAEIVSTYVFRQDERPMSKLGIHTQAKVRQHNLQTSAPTISNKQYLLGPNMKEWAMRWFKDHHLPEFVTDPDSISQRLATEFTALDGVGTQYYVESRLFFRTCITENNALLVLNRSNSLIDMITQPDVSAPPKFETTATAQSAHLLSSFIKAGIHISKDIVPLFAVANGALLLIDRLPKLVCKIFGIFTPDAKHWLESELTISTSPLFLYNDCAFKYWQAHLLDDAKSTTELNYEGRRLAAAAIAYARSENRLDSFVNRWFIDLEKVFSHPRVPATRKHEPFCVRLVGEPGVGKSITYRALIAPIFGAKTKDEIDNLCYVRGLSEYWDGCVDRPVVVFDDFGQNRKEESDVLDIISLVSDAPFMPNFANMTGANPKGTTYDPSVIIACTNATDDANFTSVRSASAISRRFHVVIDVKLDRKTQERVYTIVLPEQNNYQSTTIKQTFSSLYNHPDFITHDWPRAPMNLSQIQAFIYSTYSRFLTSRKVTAASLETNYVLPGKPSLLVNQHGRWQPQFDFPNLNRFYSSVEKSACSLYKNFLSTNFLSYVNTSILNLDNLFCISMKIVVIASAIKFFYNFFFNKIEPQSSTAKGKVKAPRVTVHSDDVEFQSSDQLSTMTSAVQKNTFSITVGRMTVNCIFVSGTTALTVEHVFIDPTSSSGSYVPDGTAILATLPFRAEPICFPFSRKSLIPVRYEKSDSDAALYTFPVSLFNQHRNILSYFWNGEYTISNRRILASDYTTIPEPTFKYENAVGQSYLEATYDVNGRLFNQRLAYGNYSGRKGQCGSPIFDATRQNAPILGIHVGKDNLTNNGLFLLVTRSLLERHLSTISPDRILASPHCSDEINGSEQGITYVQGSMELLGSLSRKMYSPTETTLQPSTLFDEIEPHCTEPSAISPSDPRIPPGTNLWENALKKLSQQMTPATPEIFSQSQQDMDEYVAGLPYFGPRRILTLSESLNGSMDFPHLKSIDMSTSCGYPWVLDGVKKDDLFYRDSAGILCPTTLFQQAYDKAWDDVRNNIIPDFLMITALKDERRPIEKVRVKTKTRLFSVAPLVMNVLLKQFFGPYANTLLENFNLVTYAGKVDRLGSSWSTMMTGLFSKSPVGFGADFGSYDGRLEKSRMIRSMRRMMIPLRDILLPEEKKMLEALIICTTEPWYLFMKVAVSVPGSLASGIWITQILGSDMTHTMLYEAWLAKVPIEYRTMYHFKTFVSLRVMGDDHIVSVVPAMTKYYNGTVVCEYFREHNMEYTSPEKDGDPEPTLPLEEIAFLKNKTGNSWGMKIPLMEYAAATEPLNWIRKHPVMTRDQLTEVNANGVLRAVFFHGEAVFNSLRERILSSKPQFSLLSYGYLLGVFRSYGSFPGAEQGEPSYYDLTETPTPAPQIEKEYQELKNLIARSMTAEAHVGTPPPNRPYRRFLTVPKTVETTSDRPPCPTFDQVSGGPFDARLNQVLKGIHCSTCAYCIDVPPINRNAVVPPLPPWLMAVDNAIQEKYFPQTNKPDPCPPEKPSVTTEESVPTQPDFLDKDPFDLGISTLNWNRKRLMNSYNSKRITHKITCPFCPPDLKEFKTINHMIVHMNTTHALKTLSNDFPLQTRIHYAPIPTLRTVAEQLRTLLSDKPVKQLDHLTAEIIQYPKIFATKQLTHIEQILKSYNEGSHFKYLEDTEPHYWHNDPKVTFEWCPDQGYIKYLEKNNLVDPIDPLLSYHRFEPHAGDPHTNNPTETSLVAGESTTQVSTTTVIDDPVNENSTARNQLGWTNREKNKLEVVSPVGYNESVTNRRAESSLNDIAWDLERVLQRWNQVGVFQWKISDAVDTVLTTLEVVQDLLSTSIVSMPFANFEKFRCSTVRFKFILVGSKFHQGRLLCGFNPTMVPKTFNRADTSKETLLEIGGVQLDPSSGSDVEFEIPWRHPKGFLDLVAGDVLGQLSIVVLNQLRAVTGSSTSVNVKVLFCLGNPEFKIPRPSTGAFRDVILSRNRMNETQKNRFVPQANDEVSTKNISSINNMTQNEALHIGPARAMTADSDVCHFGEKYTTFRDLAKRYRLIASGTETVTKDTTTQQFQKTLSLITIVQFIAELAPFRLMRGGINIKLAVRCSSVTTGVSTPHTLLVNYNAPVYPATFMGSLVTFGDTQMNNQPLSRTDDTSVAELYLPFAQHCSTVFNPSWIVAPSTTPSSLTSEFCPTGELLITLLPLQLPATTSINLSYEFYAAFADETAAGVFGGTPLQRFKKAPGIGWTGSTRMKNPADELFPPPQSTDPSSDYVHVARSQRTATPHGLEDLVDKVLERVIPDNLLQDSIGGLLDKPEVSAPPTLYKPRKTDYLCHAVGHQNIEKMQLYPSAQQTSDPEHFGSPRDEMDYRFHIKNRRCLIGTYKWTDSNLVGDVLLEGRLGPFAFMNSPLSTTAVRKFNLIDYYAKFFTFWRGGITLIIDVVTSAYHEGKLEVTYHPNALATPTTYDAKTSQYVVSSIIKNTENVFGVTFPFLSETPWKRIHNGFELKDNAVANPSPNIQDYFLGSFSILVAAPLRVPSTVSPNVDVNVYIQAADDFEFNFPSMNNHGFYDKV